MFATFFHELKQAGVPVTLREYLTLMEAMEADLGGRKVEDFYYLSRSALVKDERNLDKFDRVFGHVFKGLDEGVKTRSGAGGPSPSGNAAYKPEGIRLGGESAPRRAVKVWDRREFK